MTIARSLWALGLIALLAFAGSPPASAQEGYRINPGDVLAVEVLQDPSLNREILVLPDGSISFPFAGTIRAGGRTISQVQAALIQGIASNFAVPPNVFVTVRQIDAGELEELEEDETISVFFLGELANQGEAPLPPGTTFLQALSRTGGFSNFAATHRIQLRRTDPISGEQTVREIDYRSIMRGAIPLQPIVLRDGDIILVPERGLFE